LQNKLRKLLQILPPPLKLLLYLVKFERSTVQFSIHISRVLAVFGLNASDVNLFVNNNYLHSI